MLLTFKTAAFYYKLTHEINYENILISPPYNGHIILLYENESDLDNAIATYINEGLKRDQLCLHASVNLNNRDYIENFSSQITNYQENIEKGNLMIIDLTLYYVQAMVGNLDPFNKLKEEIVNIVNKDRNRKDKHVRLTADCATLLFKNQHFNQCILLEEWWHQEPFPGSYICPYPKYLVNQFPYNAYFTRLFLHDDVITYKNARLE
ncbi:MEDS domain-containing protein [Candidatus Nitrosocosmicus sp. T]